MKISIKVLGALRNETDVSCVGPGHNLLWGDIFFAVKQEKNMMVAILGKVQLDRDATPRQDGIHWCEKVCPSKGAVWYFTLCTCGNMLQVSYGFVCKFNNKLFGWSSFPTRWHFENILQIHLLGSVFDINRFGCPAACWNRNLLLEKTPHLQLAS